MTLDALDPRVRVVTAPAGSGKTTLLVHHYLAHLASSSVDRIVAITFTRKAAAELTGRVAQVLEGICHPSATPGPAKERMELFAPLGLSEERARVSLRGLASAPVCTVDAFALSLVQEFLLHAHFPLSDGRRVYIDGPIRGGTDTSAVWVSAARAQIDRLAESARVLLGEMSLSEASEDVARLARSGLCEASSAETFLEQIARALAPDVERDPDAWLEEQPGALSDEQLQAVALWLRSPRTRPPAALLAFLAGIRSKPLQPIRARVFQQALGALGFAWNGELPFDKLRRPFAAFAGNEVLARADRVRRALLDLALATRDDAYAELARRGELGYDELLAAATALCCRPPPELASRYEALLVDELQDTNPSQLAFFRAFSRMPGSPRPMATFFVGDVRQSIYRFRHADPHGWRSVIEEAEREGTRADLTVNHRSSSHLVEAQRSLFGALAELDPRGVEKLERLSAAERTQQRLGSEVEAPVVVVDGPEAATVDEHVLAEFAGRLQARWRTHPKESAAVLVRSWATASWAARILRERGLAAQLTGDRSLLQSRVAADVRLFLRALIDPGDEIAVVGLLKHPSVGISDRGLAALNDAGSPARIFSEQARFDALEADDRAALEAALPALRRARKALGREPSARVLERLCADLSWRPLLAAGPEGEGNGGQTPLAQLEILLEIARQTEAEQVDPQAVLEALAPAGDEGRSDLPVVRLREAQGTVTITTVYAAKGLEFDHLALLEVHKSGSDGVVGGSSFRLARQLRGSLLGVRIDPEGGLSPGLDPLSAIASSVGDDEAVGEGLRLFYVGFTRAARSVVFGLKAASRNKLAKLLREALADPGMAGKIRTVVPDDSKLVPYTRPARERIARIRPFEAVWAEPRGWELERPSRLSGTSVRRAETAAREFERRAIIVEGTRAPPLPATEREIPENVLGELAHGWLERWGFTPTPSIAEASAYLAGRWGVDLPALAGWLVETGLNLRDGLPGFKNLLGHRLHFEWPVLGIERGVIWSGRTDLVVEMPGREVMVLDFKAGRRAAAAGAQVPGLREYAFQLAAYQRALEGAGYRVRELGLVYVRGASWVRFGAGQVQDNEVA
jgi:ATP-dependent exoDNAse (exonuclease V) beta subunit